MGLTIMLRVYFLQHWFVLSDPAVEDALYESVVMRRFAGIDMGRCAGAGLRMVTGFRHECRVPVHRDACPVRAARLCVDRQERQQRDW